jgi:MFS family permease
MQPAQRDGLFAPARRALTIGLVLTVTLVAFEALAVVTILPVIKDDLGGLRLYGWVTSAFFLGTLVGIVVAGAEADRRGPGPPYVLGIALFAAGLVIGGLAPSMLVLVLARALQGIGAGAIPATAYVAIGRSYPEALRPRVFAVLSTAWVVPGLIGPALSALVATHVGWRTVFLGLLPLVLVAGGLALPAVRRIGPPERGDAAGDPAAAGAPAPAPRSPRDRARLLDAVRVSAGAGLLLAGLTSRSIPLALGLAAAGLLVGVRPLLRLLPAGTLRARRGMPMAVLSRGMLTFAFFGTDTYVPLAITAVRGRSPAMASLAVTAATLSWALGSWLQERGARALSSRLLVRVGLLIVALGIGVMGVSLLGTVPVALAVVAWGIGGLGIGIAYAPITVTVLGLAPAAEQGRASAQLQLSDTLGTALGAGLGGVLVALGAASGWRQSTALTGVFILTGAVALVALLLSRRLPDHRVAASAEDGRRPGPAGRGARAAPDGPESRRSPRGA